MVQAKIIKKVVPNFLIKRRLTGARDNSVLLTFDDGPTKSITPRVLDILDKYQAKAVFFVVGRRIAKIPGYLKEILSRGHIIGNHSYRHTRFEDISFATYRDDLINCNELIKKETGLVPSLYRPPCGTISLKGFMAARAAGLSSLFWSNDGGENGYNKSLTSDEVSELIISKLKPRDIILLHDDNARTPEILENILPHLKQRNFDVTHGVDGLSPKLHISLQAQPK